MALRAANLVPWPELSAARSALVSAARAFHPARRGARLPYLRRAHGIPARDHDGQHAPVERDRASTALALHLRVRRRVAPGVASSSVGRARQVVEAVILVGVGLQARHGADHWHADHEGRGAIVRRACRDEHARGDREHPERCASGLSERDVRQGTFLPGSVARPAGSGPCDPRPFAATEPASRARRNTRACSDPRGMRRLMGSRPLAVLP